MASEIIKANPNNRSLAHRTLARQTMIDALARLRRTGEHLKKHEQDRLTRLAPHVPSEIVDLPRMCAVHDRPYAARYVRASNGRYRYAQSVKVTEAVFLSQYADSLNDVCNVPSNDIGEETCAWCAASGSGSVLCGSCKKEVCYGKTTGRFFRCRVSCGGEGNMVSGHRRYNGVSPRLLEGSGFTQG